MSDLLQRLKAGTKSFKLIQSPWDPTVQIAIRVLSEAQYTEAMIQTELFFKSKQVTASLTTSTEWEIEKQCRYLYMALQDPADGFKPIAESITRFRELMTPADMKFFSDEYASFEEECSPRPDNLSNDEFDRIVSELKKKPKETIMSLTNLGLLRRLLLFMASRPAN